MVSKTNTSASFRSTVSYLTGRKKEHELVLSYGVRADRTGMVQDFELQASMNPRIKQAVFHCSLSHHPDDSFRIYGKESDILLSWLDGMKQKKGVDFAKTQFAIIKHKDRAHVHYHLVANMVGNDGKRFNIDYIGLKAKDISKEITRQYELTPAISKEQRAILEAEKEVELSLPKKDIENSQDNHMDRGGYRL